MYHRRRRETWGQLLRRNGATVCLGMVVMFVVIHVVLDHREDKGASEAEDRTGSPVRVHVGAWNTPSRQQGGGRAKWDDSVLPQRTGSAHKAVKPSSHVGDHRHVDKPNKGNSNSNSDGDGDGKGDEKTHKHDSHKWPQLSAELVAKYASPSGKILVTFANHNHEDYIRNWVYHLAAIPMQNYLVCAFDDELMEYLVQNGLHAAFVPAVLEKQTFEWGSSGFKKLNRYKWEAALNILDWGFGLFITDADTVYFRDPLRWIEDYGEDADILASTDYLRPTTWKDELERLDEIPIAWWAQNIGMMFLSPTRRMVRFMQQWTKLMDENPDFGNQWSFTEMLSAGVGVSYADGINGVENVELASNGTFWACNHTVTLGMLPLAYFANGHSYFEQRGWEKRGTQPVAVHTTYVYAFNGAKRHRFRDEHLWVDDESYYTTGHFLVFDSDPPAELLVDHSWDVPFDKVPADHLVLIDYQIQRVFEALAVARTLNRTLILPPVLATCDRYFAQLNYCRYPHAEKEEIEFPMVVPADHVFSQELLREVREANFLSNPRVPMSVVTDSVFVNVCDKLKGTRAPVAGISLDKKDPSAVTCQKDRLARFNRASYAPSRALLLRAGLTDQELVEALAPAQNAQILHFSSMEGTFAGFEDRENALAFLKDARTYIGTWCCTAPTGAIHYDSAPEFIAQDLIDAVPPKYVNKFPYKDENGAPLRFSPPPSPKAKAAKRG